jgi:hypothetical protein
MRLLPAVIEFTEAMRTLAGSRDGGRQADPTRRVSLPERVTTVAALLETAIKQVTSHCFSAYY